MKKSILTALAVAGVAGLSYGQGVVTFDTTASTSQSLGYVSISGVLDTSTDVNAELLAGSTPVVTLLLSVSSGPSGVTTPYGAVVPAASDITFYGTGQLLDTSGNLYQDPSNASGTIESMTVEAWTGSYASLALAQAGGAKWAVSAPFNVTLSNTGSPENANIANMPSINLTSVPEPATFALAGLGIASLLAFRRRSS